MSQYYMLIPEKVNNEINVVHEHFKKLKVTGYSLDNLREIISLICYNIRKDEDNKAHLKIEYLRKYVPHAELYLHGLEDIGIVKTSGSYQASVTSKTYWFSESYDSKFRKYPVPNGKLKNRIEKAQRSLKKKNTTKYTSQGKFLRSLQIDMSVYDFIERTISETRKYNYAYASATRILQGDIKYSVDATSNRFHSNLTNMPKVMRKFVTVNGLHLTNVDIKNSQPYISTLILTNPAKVAQFARSADLKTLLLKLTVSMTEDVLRYIDLVVNGRIYEYLLDEFQKRGLGYETRDDVKRQMLIILFDMNVHVSKSRKVFAELFPEVHRVFSLVRGGQRGNKFDSYQRFSILLQRIEAHLVLDVIERRINKEYPEIITLTIHDSIMTSLYTDHVQVVKGIMEEEMTHFVGFMPKVKIEG